MTTTDTADLVTERVDDVVGARPYRFRMHRAGILNVWQYDDQEFEFADGRLLLRGANGAGKSKTLEMLLPFVLDGDKARMTASARHHTSLLWLMTDGYEGQARVGYLWVEFARRLPDGSEEFLTCGVGLRASVSARTASAWFFTTPLRVGAELQLDDGSGPLSRPRLAEVLGDGGQVFDQARAYKEHVGRVLFGLAPEQYDDVLRLLYWLRQPQVGEDIEPARLAGQLLQALPQLDEQTLRGAGDTFDELVAVGEQIARRAAAAHTLSLLSDAYADYAGAVAAERAALVRSRHTEQTRRRNELRQAEERHRELGTELAQSQDAATENQRAIADARARLAQLDQSPEARSQRRLSDLTQRAVDLRRAATGAGRAAAAAESAWTTREARSLEDRTAVLARVAAHGEQARRHDDELRSLDLATSEASTLAATLAEPGQRLAGQADASRLDELLADQLDSVTAADHAVGRRLGVLTVVGSALDELAAAATRSAQLEERAALAETRWEAAVSQCAVAEKSVDERVRELGEQLRVWAAAGPDSGWQPPQDLTADAVGALAESAAAAAEPVLARLRDEEQRAVGQRQRAEDQVAALDRRRVEIEAEVDPAPPGPALVRTDRPDGAPLWRMIDFAAETDQETRAGLEAALQASGLLDAWVRPDGQLLGAEHLDVVLSAALGATDGQASADTLADVLVADLPVGSDVSEAVLDSVLRRVGVVASVTQPNDGRSAWIGRDGTWSLGPLHGRAGKERAQYVGATARAEERKRRLDEVATALEHAERTLTEAKDAASRIGGRIAAVQRWLRDLPSGRELIRAWATLEERAEAAQREEANHRAAAASAQEARRVAAQRQADLDRLGREHDVPVDRDGLEALSTRLQTLSRELIKLGGEVPGLRRDLERWGYGHTALVEERAEVDRLVREASEAVQRADQSEAEVAELEAAAGADIAQLRARMAQLREALAQGENRQVELSDRLARLHRDEGAAAAEVRACQERLADGERDLHGAVASLAVLLDVPGLLGAAARDHDNVDLAPLHAARGARTGDPLPTGLLALARSLAGATSADGVERANQVYKAHAEASTGPAADHEPRVLTIGGVLAVVGRDEGGEHPVTELSRRVGDAVERDRALLTQRERAQFEQHILGELGDAIRRRKVEAEELVAAMNTLLGRVSTSQGIRVRLDWRLRDDVPGEAREAVRLLTQPLGALLPEERSTLRDCLHRLIEVSRAERPDLSYAEHLAIALDYRQWHVFRIRYTRPEAEGRWSDLHRRSPLSQGEQKVLCYLPLFAAAAAHFTSLAGAAPHAPRLILLDDAFPKIDVRTHPLLFGLLVQLDLDFVITSERLWGDHDTLPSLAIYEALRDPNQRGIAHFEFRWDGRVLRAMHG